MPSAPTTTEIVRETRHGLVVKMRLEGHTYQAISDRLGLSVSQCHRVFQAAWARRRGDLDIERHRDEIYADIEMVLEALRPFVFGTPAPPDIPEPNKEHLAAFRGMIEAKMKLLGAAAPKESHVMHEDVNVTEAVHPAAEKLARLAAWARETNAINVDGYQPALPPGMTERPAPAPGMNGHGKVHGKGMWSLVLENPSDD